MYRIIITLFLVILIGSCNLGSKYEQEFKNHTKGSDLVIFDGDFLHPEKVYLKDNKPIGFEYRSGSEFGSYTKLTFIDNLEEIEKIIIRKDFFSNLEVTFDSIYVIEPKLPKVTVYSNKNGKGEEVPYSKIFEKELFDLDEKIDQIKNWKK